MAAHACRFVIVTRSSMLSWLVARSQNSRRNSSFCCSTSNSWARSLQDSTFKL